MDARLDAKPVRSEDLMSRKTLAQFWERKSGHSETQNNMKTKTLSRVYFLVLFLPWFSPVFGQEENPIVEQSTVIEETPAQNSSVAEPPVASEKITAENPAPVEEKVEAEVPEPVVVDTRFDDFEKLLSSVDYGTEMKSEKKSRLRALVMAAYRESDLLPIWRGALGLAEINESLTALLANHGFEKPAANFGIDPALEKALVPARDVAITLNVAEACLRLKQGPDSVAKWPNWTPGDAPFAVSTNAHYKDLAARFGKASLSGNPRMVAESFIPKNWIYKRLLGDLQKADLAPEPPTITIQGLVKVGNEFPDAALLAEFLKREGHLPSENAELVDGVFSQDLSDAVRSFQKKNGLQSDGILGPKTADHISRNNEKEKEILLLNLHRSRRFPDSPGERYLLANLPSGEVYGFDGEKEAIRMRIVFGKNIRGQRTPVFRDKMEEVVFRPYWNVPYSIATKESNYSNLSYLSRNGFKIISSSTGAQLPLAESSIGMVYQQKAYVRQDAGNGNALGLVKFLFPNKHAVYFHDTPQKHYFKNGDRARSHGCVRLQEPEAMANWVLKDDENWNADSIKNALHNGGREVVKLENPIPVYLVYLTALPNPQEEEGVIFYRDRYSYDLPNAVIDAPVPRTGPKTYTTSEPPKKSIWSIFGRRSKPATRSSGPTRSYSRGMRKFRGN